MGEIKMNNKINILAILTLLWQLLFLPCVSAEIFKWVDEKGTTHFTEDESAIPEKYRQQVEKRPSKEEPGSQKEKVGADKKEKKGSTKRSPKEPPRESKEKERVNIRRIELDVADAFKNIISLWKDKKYEALYDCGDRKSHTNMAREDFRKRMEGKGRELATSWETVRDIQVDVKNATQAYVTARIGYRPQKGGETRIRTETFEMKFETGTWRINLTKVLAPSK
jgi:hypothetical protein